MVDFAVELLANAQPDIERLLPAQWVHTGDKEIECKPNWNLYRHFEANKALLLVTARQEGWTSGYLAAFIYPHPNAMTELVADIPTYFVVEGPMRGLMLSRMVDFALERLAERGVFKVNIETNAEHSAGRLWELKGFELAKFGYSMKLKKLLGEQYA